MAIKGYETITHELSQYELDVVLPMLVAKICHHKGRKNAITNARLRGYMSERNATLNEPRLRKIVEHIRQTHLLPGLVAAKQGYFIAESPEEMREWLDTMKQRKNALAATIYAGELTLRQMVGFKQPNQHKKRKVNDNIQQQFIL